MPDDTPPADGAPGAHAHGPGAHSHADGAGLPGGLGGSQECLLCPVCVFLQAMSQSRPEVTQHLLAAARELTLALRAVVETQVAAHERAAEAGGRGGSGKDRFERINVD